MFKKSFKLKIFIIFTVPAIALIYFSIYIIDFKYKELNNSSALMLSANITQSISKFIHNIQIERGLSAGYIVTNEKSIHRSKLIKQHQNTDKAHQELLHFIKLNSHDKKLILNLDGSNTLPNTKLLLNQLYKLKNIRKLVLDSKITLEDELNYYTKINAQLLKKIKSLGTLLNRLNKQSVAIYRLEELKEKTGLQRAYMYAYILSNNKHNDYIPKINSLIKAQKQYKKDFKTEASLNYLVYYNQSVSSILENSINKFIDEVIKQNNKNMNASHWFALSSKQINEYEILSIKIIDDYIKGVYSVYNDAKASLYTTALLWFLSIGSFVGLTFILNKLLKKEEESSNELRIASYTFDSHEAMTITDVNGIILKVNQAFSDITGYEPSDVIGKNPRVLKSLKHTNEFYKNMWNQLHTVGKWSDEIYNKRKNGEIYLERLSITAIKDENNITTHYIAQFLDISDLKKAQEDAIHQAYHDFLTKLPNRKSMNKRLKEEFIKAKRHDFIHAFLFIDLDGFKSVNDNYGHGIGDKLLIAVSQKFITILREEDFVARMSGDEFAIMIFNIDKDEYEAAKDVKAVCEKIIRELSKPFYLDEYKINIGASIGVKLFPDGEKEIADVIHHADAAMYQAKQQGKNRFVFFDKAIELEIKQYNLLEEELKKAYENEEFVFYFQPKVDTNTMQIAGAEILLRWMHPIKGIQYPNTFLKVLKEIGMIPKISALAIHSASKFIKEHNDAFKGVISINIDSTELLSNDFIDNVKRIVNSYNIEPSCIELEILEGELIKDFDKMVIQINKLKDFGIKFSIDDFGTGYSSISYLQKLPVDTLKIDRHFMHDISNESNRKLVKIILEMAKEFNLATVVEGVETKSQLDLITQNNADQYQGYYFSKAIDEKAFQELIINNSIQQLEL